MGYDREAVALDCGGKAAAPHPRGMAAALWRAFKREVRYGRDAAGIKGGSFATYLTKRGFAAAVQRRFAHAYSRIRILSTSTTISFPR